MFKSITVNYSTRDFFGQHEFRSDTYHGPIDRDIVRKVLSAVQRNSWYYAHFNREDGSDECITQGYEAGTFRLTHFDSWNSKDDEVTVKVADFRKMVLAELE